MNDQLIVVSCKASLDGNETDVIFRNLWHFANLFPTFSFKVNGIDFNCLTEMPPASVVKEDTSNIIELSFTDSSLPNIKADIKILNEIFRDFSHFVFAIECGS